MLNPEEKIILLNALIDLTAEKQLKARIKESITEWQGRLEDWDWYQTSSMALYDKIFIPHDFGHGDIVYIRGAWNQNELGFILGYDEACHDFYKNSKGDYSDVQICVETIFAADGKLRAEFSHQHVNPIYIERAVLCHDDSRKAYMEQILGKSECVGRRITEELLKRTKEEEEILKKDREQFKKDKEPLVLGRIEQFYERASARIVARSIKMIEALKEKLGETEQRQL